MNPKWVGLVGEIEKAVTPLHKEIDRISAEVKHLEQHLVDIGAGSASDVVVEDLSFCRVSGKFRITYKGRVFGECTREERIEAYYKIPLLLETILKHLARAFDLVTYVQPN